MMLYLIERYTNNKDTTTMKQRIKQLAQDTLDVIAYSVVGILTVIAVDKLEPHKAILEARDRIINLHHYKATFAKAKLIHAKLAKHSGMPHQIPGLKLHDSTMVNAFVTANDMYITQGMLDHAKSDAELAYVLGHEMGHTMLYHTTRPPNMKYTDSRIHEANVDKIAIYLMVRTGYNICNVGDVWKRLGDKYGHGAASDSHPSYLYRMHELTFPNCGG